MPTEESRAVVQSWVDSTARGDIDAALALFDENAVWTNIGSTRFSGQYVGLRGIMEDLIGPLFAELEAGIQSEVEALIADGDRAVLLSRGTARTRDGKAYNNVYAQVFTVVNGRIVAVREYMDTALVDAAFGAAP
ncbi:MAG: nuclear transport factor 2 family protein [Halieaceae bacterium]|jgi:ketosteroid isomerase-like protein|nr:nuclear transport factor 2 family protein [Halieaceae bacterium]